MSSAVAWPLPPAELRRDHDPVSLLLEDSAEIGLALALAVGVGRVEMRDACLEGGRDDCPGSVEVEPSAEVVAAEADDGNVEVACSDRARIDGPASGPAAV